MKVRCTKKKKGKKKIIYIENGYALEELNLIALYDWKGLLRLYFI